MRKATRSGWTKTAMKLSRITKETSTDTIRLEIVSIQNTISRNLKME